MDYRDLFWYLEELFLVVSSGFLIRQGFRDETFGMPFLGVVLTTAWGFWFSFYVSKIYFVQPVYFIVQSVILGQLIMFGPNEFFAGHRLPFYGMLVAAVLPSLGLVRALIDEEGRSWCHDQLFYAIAMITNVLFVHMLLSRGDARGQHRGAAVCRCLAMACAWFSQDAAVSAWLIGIAVLADLTYLGLLHACLEDPQSFRRWQRFLVANDRGMDADQDGDSYRGAPLLVSKGADGRISYEPTPTTDPHATKGAQFEMFTTA